MSTAKKGDTVKVHYTGSFPDGEVFDSSKKRDPLEFMIGKGQVIPGFDTAVIDMKIGDSKKIVIAPENAYGEKREDLVIQVDKKEFPEDLTLETGVKLQLKLKNDQDALATITDVSDTAVTLDLNHPLAGKELTFEIELVEVVS